MAYAGKIFGEGFKVVGGLVEGPGVGRGTPDAGEFSKICKNILKKIAKMHYFSLNFCALGRKQNWLGNFRENFENF